MVLPLSAFAAGDPKAGEEAAAVCAACHGMDGNSVDPQYPKLAGQHEAYTARMLRLYKSGERDNGIMMAFAVGLSEQQILDISAFYATQIPQAGLADEDLVSLGERVYRAGNPATGLPACMACHGPSGLGNPYSGYPMLAGQHADYTQTQLIAYRDGQAFGRDANVNRIMAEVSRQLSDEEIRALASYIEGLHTAP